MKHDIEDDRDEAGKWLVIRADAGRSIGAGHVIRCLALAQAWHDRGGQAIFVSSCAGTPLGKYLESEGFPVEPAEGEAGSTIDAGRCVEMLRSYGAAWLVADGYCFGGDFQHRVKESGDRLILIDDYGCLDAYDAEVVLNQNPSAEACLYPEGPRLLLGTRYALLRRQFLRYRNTRRRINPDCRRILVTLGAADPENITARALGALNGIIEDRLEIRVVISAANPHADELERVAEDSAHRVSLEREVREMEELMVWADLAVSAGGSTCWELAFLGLPNIILVLAENQRRSAEAVHDLGVSINLGPVRGVRLEELVCQLDRLRKNPELRRAMSEQGCLLVDGRGADRVVAELLIPKNTIIQ